MSERFNNDTALRSEDRSPTQGQERGQERGRGQGLYNVDPSTRDQDFTGPDIPGEGRGPGEGQGQGKYNVDPSNTRNPDFTGPDIPGEGRGPGQGREQGQGQGQGQGKYNVDPSTRDQDFTGPDIPSKDRGPGQGQGQEQGHSNDRARHPHFGNGSGDPHQRTGQSVDPKSAHHDPTRGQHDQGIRPSGTDERQGYPQQGQQGQRDPQQGQQGQWRQGGQTASDNIPGGFGEPRQAQHIAGGGYQGPSTGSGPGAGYRCQDQDIHTDGAFGGKASLPERLMGTAEKMVGKATGNSRMYDHGQGRKEGGY